MSKEHFNLHNNQGMTSYKVLLKGPISKQTNPKLLTHTSAATSQSGRPSLSFSSTYGLSWTLFKSSWRPSKRKARSSCESCCWKPLNLGAYFAIVHYKKKKARKLILHHVTKVITINQNIVDKTHAVNKHKFNS